MKRGIGLVLAAIVAVGVVVAIVASTRPTGSSSASDRPPVEVHGVIGSEKGPFFDDPRVQAEFRANGYQVVVDTAGSRQIATSVDLSTYDFAFPAGAPAARQILVKAQRSTSYTVFYTPMVVASFTPIAKLLVKAGVATDQGGYYTLDMHGFLKLVADNTRWSDLQGNAVYPSDKSILITSTDVRTSNSAAMYLSIASYVANHDNVVENTSQAAAVLHDVAPLFLRQGFVEASTEEPFDDYLAIGVGKTPLVMIYEAQFLSRAFAADGSITPDMVLMYPDPDVLSKHTLVPLSDEGEAVGQLLLNDPVLQRLAVQYGFRTSDPSLFKQQLSKHPVPLPDTIVDLIEPPTYENLEHMIEGISAMYGSG
jgi:hypothetical protein